MSICVIHALTHTHRHHHSKRKARNADQTYKVTACRADGSGASCTGPTLTFNHATELERGRLVRGVTCTTTHVRFRIIEAPVCPAVSEFSLFCDEGFVVGSETGKG